MLSYKVFSTTVFDDWRFVSSLLVLWVYQESWPRIYQESKTLGFLFCFDFVFFLIPDISLKYENVTLGYTHYESKQSDVFYLFKLILLLAKYFIHKCKFCKPFFNIFSWRHETLYVCDLSVHYLAPWHMIYHHSVIFVLY